MEINSVVQIVISFLFSVDFYDCSVKFRGLSDAKKFLFENIGRTNVERVRLIFLSGGENFINPALSTNLITITAILRTGACRASIRFLFHKISPCLTLDRVSSPKIEKRLGKQVTVVQEIKAMQLRGRQGNYSGNVFN